MAGATEFTSGIAQQAANRTHTNTNPEALRQDRLGGFGDLAWVSHLAVAYRKELKFV